MADYEIRYLRRDGTTSVFYRPNCLGDREARRRALEHVGDGLASAEIWKDLDRLEIIPLEHAA